MQADKVFKYGQKWDGDPLLVICHMVIFQRKKNQEIEHVYCAGIRLIYNLRGWNDYVTLVLSHQKSLLDYVYDYWKRFMKHLNESPEGNECRETWEAYLICQISDKSFYGFKGK